MSSLKAVHRQITLQQTSEVYALTAAADQAASSGNREACIDFVARIYCLLDSTYSSKFDQN